LENIIIFVRASGVLGLLATPTQARANICMWRCF